MIGKLRIISGLVLFLFVIGHLSNHALGIISLRAMNEALQYSISPWRHPIGEAILLIALLVHAILALYSLYERRSLKMGKSDLAQLSTGFLIPCLLAGHVLGTRGLHEVFGVVEGYEFTLFAMWVPSVFYGVLNIFALIVVWFHSCLGLHNWLRFKSWYEPLQPYLLSLAVLFPTLALAGYASASLRVSRLSGSEKWVERLFKRTSDQLDQFQTFLSQNEPRVILSVVVAVLVVLAARQARQVVVRSRSASGILYRDSSMAHQYELALQPGASLLDHIRVADIPHASVCGGRGRCSTCRVKVDEGSDTLAKPGPIESKILQRIDAPDGVRLACQAVPTAPMTVTALLLPSASARDLLQRTSAKSGEEQDIAVLFADIRQFTKLSETRLPYDTAFLLNRYFAAMGEAIEEAGGRIDKFIGDGVMALFGVNESHEVGCRKAVAAAVSMSERLEVLNRNMAGDLPFPLRIGIGIHSGTTIVGEMGYSHSVNLTAIGDVVNTASRLETLTKEHSVQMLISNETAELSGYDFSEHEIKKVEIRGRDEKLPVHLVSTAKSLVVKS